MENKKVVEGFSNYEQFKKDNSFLTHLLLETLSSNHFPYTSDDFFGGDMDKFNLGISINGTELDATAFLTILEETFYKWEDNYNARVKSDVNRYVVENIKPTKQIGEITESLYDINQVFENLKDKIDCLNNNIEWNDKVLQE
jgi:hypothetical protein